MKKNHTVVIIVIGVVIGLFLLLGSIIGLIVVLWMGNTGNVPYDDPLSNLHYPKHFEIENNKPYEIKEDILINYYYANYAWGYVYYGELITTSGKIYQYNCGSNYKNNDPKKCIMKESGKISSEDLQKLKNLNVKEDIKEKMIANDFGEIEILYYKDKQKITLSCYGDVECITNNKDSKEALKILRKYGFYIK